MIKKNIENIYLKFWKIQESEGVKKLNENHVFPRIYLRQKFRIFSYS